MDRNQRSRNQKKSVPPRKGQPSHRNTKSAPPQRSSRPAGSQQRPKGSGQRPAKQPERQPPKQQQKRPRPNARNIQAPDKTSGLSQEEKAAQRKKATEYYNNANVKPGSLAAKANMVKQFDEKNTKKK